MDETDKIIKDIWNTIRSKKPGNERKSCPDDRQLLCYLNNIQSDSDKESMEQHFLECSDCLSFIILYNKLEKGSLDACPDTPAAWIDKIKNALPEKKKITAKAFDIVVKFLQETVEVLENTGDLIISTGPFPVPVRGGTGSVSPNVIALRKTFPEITSEVEVEKTDNNLINIKVTAADLNSGLPVRNVRISIFNPDQEMASFIAAQGETIFTEMRFGEYAIELSRERKKIGRLSLKLMQ
jgi:hypothetical protein